MKPDTERQERNRQMAEMREAGALYREISEMFGISRQAIWEIFIKDYPDLVGRCYMRKRVR